MYKMENETTTAVVFEEDHEVYVITMTTISVILLLFTLLAIIALRRTKSTPETARFLSSGLLFFDITGTLSFTLRRFVVNHVANIFVQVSGVYCLYIAYVTIGIMSFERLIIFSSPHFYLRCVTPRRVKIIVTSIWAILTLLYFFVRYGLCFIMHENGTIYDVIGRCNTVSYAFYGLFIILTCIASAACYTRIVLIERAKVKHDKSISLMATLRGMMKYKTTGIVFLYIVSIFLTSAAYAYVLIALKSDTYGTRISIDITNMFSCVIDPCLYVLWYRECRYEVMKMFRCLNPRLASKLEHMRIEIFNVVLTERKQLFRNKVEPLTNPEVLVQI